MTQKRLKGRMLVLGGGLLSAALAFAGEPAPSAQNLEKTLDKPEILAGEVPEPEAPWGLVESFTGFNINKTSFMESLGVRLDGWVEVGIGGNPRGSIDGFNGPVTFNDRTNDPGMNELYIYLERAVNDQGSAWDFGFRADMIYGTDARFTTAKNLDDKLLDAPFYKMAFPQFYVDVFAPIGNGVTMTVGHFYTIIGYEVVTAPDNFFFSHAYTMQYGEPFTHTGALLSYPINDNFSVTGGVTSGWDAFFQDPPNFLGGVNFTSDNEKTSVAVSLITGDASQDNRSNRTLYSIVASHDFTEDLHYVFQHDFGVEQNATFFGETAYWYGVNQYLSYDVMDELAAGLRFEWFRDEDGVRVGFGPNSYFEITGGLNWKPASFLTVRPEVRYDWSTANPAFDGATRENQFLISVDAIIQF